MAVLNQGEQLEETPVVDANGNPVDTPASTSSKSLPKINPKILAVGVIAVVVIAGIVIISNSGKKKEDVAVQEQTEDIIETTEFVNPLDSVLGNGSGENTGNGKAYSTGDKFSSAYEFSFYDEYDTAYLRGLGYTGDEIEYYSQSATPVADLEEKAWEHKKSANQKWVDSIIDQSSEGYQELRDSTFIGGEDTSNTSVTAEDVSSRVDCKENVDYTKCGVYNNQAWIKVELSTGTTNMTVTLYRYNELADSGNILIQYSKALDKDGNVLFIDNLKELKL